MRKTINPQPNLREPWLELEHARELETISSLLDAHPKLNELVLQDLKSVTPSAGSDVGRGGMSAEQVLRALLVKQLNQFSYRELAFHLADSRSYRTFCQLGIIEPTPSKSTLAANIKAVKFETLEQINRELVSVAEDAGIEKGRKVRVDCTVVASNIHPPTDSELLYDCVRVLTRLMCGARELLGTVVVFGNRTRRAKRRRLGVLNAKDKQQRRRVYRDLLKVTEETYRSAQRVAEQLEESGLTEPVKRASTERVAADFAHFLVLTKKVINQTQRRVIDEERVPAEEKVVSVFEEHTDIIRKDRRETLYGHKVCLTGGSSSMILDCVILDGNPADSTLAETMIDRQVELYERAPRQVAYDGAFSSKANLEAIKGKGVEDVAFTKAQGFAVTDMVKSSWVYQRLRRFRCGIEGVISFLKRVFGLDRCTWRSLPSFKSYVWGSIITCNLSAASRHLVSQTTKKLEQYLSRRLEEYELAALMMDGLEVAGQTVVVTLGITIDGTKVPLGIWLGSTENSQVCTAMLQDLLERGLRIDESILCVVDGGKGIRKALVDVLGDLAVIQRCHFHKLRNLRSYLPKSRHAYVLQTMKEAYKCKSADKARKQLRALVSWLERNGYDEAAGSLREGMEETLTVLKLALPELLRRSLATTNAIENLNGTIRRVSRNVKRWKSPSMIRRWTALGVVTAEKKFRRIKGYRNMGALVHALKSKQKSLDSDEFAA